MNSPEKQPNKDREHLDLVEEARKTIAAAKSWLLEDTALMEAYWHDKMGYMEAWVSANWHRVLEQSSETIHELDELEDAGLLWLIDHVNNNPVPLAQCHAAGETVEEGVYRCMSCGHEQLLPEPSDLLPCDICHYGIFSSHTLHSDDKSVETE